MKKLISVILIALIVLAPGCRKKDKNSQITEPTATCTDVIYEEQVLSEDEENSREVQESEEAKETALPMTATIVRGKTNDNSSDNSSNSSSKSTNDRTVVVKNSVSVSATYGYYEMMGDIEMLVSKYSQYLTEKTLGYSEFGREIPIIVMGNKNAENKILIVASSHAREYGNTVIVMKMIEHCCENMSSSYKGKTIGQLLDSTQIYFIPMHNPDGVEISLYGLDSVPEQYKSVVSAIYQKSVKKGLISSYKKWKANGLGVDLNRDYGLGLKTSTQIHEALSENFGGDFSSKEGKAIADLIRTIDFKSVTSFHSCGQITYWGSFASGSFKEECFEIAKEIKACNGYALVDESAKIEKDYPYYGLKDWFMKDFQKPAYTIETGTSTPLSLSEIKTELNKNMDVPLIMLYYAYTEPTPTATVAPTAVPTASPTAVPTLTPTPVPTPINTKSPAPTVTPEE